jgi:putative membrane protein
MKVLLMPVTIAVVTASLPSFADAPSPADFVKHAIRGDISEIRLGELAEQKAQSQTVRQFGSLLREDHTKAQAQAEQLANNLHVKVQAEPTAGAKKEMDKLKGLEGQKFDREFLNYMIEDHQKDISEFKEAVHSDNSRIAQMARETLPVLRKHLQTAEQAKKELKGR